MAYKFNKNKDREIFNTGFFEGFRVASTGQVEQGWAPPGVDPTLEINLEYLKTEHFQRDFAEAAIIGFEAGRTAVKGLKKDRVAYYTPDVVRCWGRKPKANQGILQDSDWPDNLWAQAQLLAGMIPEMEGFSSDEATIKAAVEAGAATIAARKPKSA